MDNDSPGYHRQHVGAAKRSAVSRLSMFDPRTGAMIVPCRLDPLAAYQ